MIWQAGITASNASYRQLSNATRLYAVNMQFSNGAAQSDKINNMLLLAAGSDSAAAPTPDNFGISLLNGAPAGITAIVPYTLVPNLYFVQVAWSFPLCSIPQQWNLFQMRVGGHFFTA